MNLNTQGIIFVIIIGLIVVAAIIVGNWFFKTFLGVDVSNLPPFFKFLIHMSGLAIVGYILVKFFNR